MKLIKTGILGGSFDPPTIGHALMAAELINQKIVDKIIFVPCGDRQDKQLTKGYHRVKMLELMINNIFKQIDNIEINDIEIKNGQMIPTYYMLNQIKTLYNNIYFVIGSDLVDTLSTWQEGEKLKSEFQFIIINRTSSSLDKIDISLLPKNYITIPDFDCRISSTEIRRRIMQSNSSYLDCLGIVVTPVLEYIIQNKLYI